MLRLYYSDQDFIEVGGMPLNDYHKTKIKDQRNLGNLGWGTVAAFSNPGWAKSKPLLKAVIETFTTNTPLYLFPLKQVLTKYSLRKGGGNSLVIVYDGVDVCEYRYYDDWESDTYELRLLSFYSDDVSDDSIAANLKHAKEFTGSAFDFEQQILNGTVDVEIPGITPLTQPFVLAKCKKDGANGEVYGERPLNLLNAGNAANVGRGLLGRDLIPHSTFIDKTGRNYEPSVAYNPEKWNGKLWAKGSDYAYEYDNNNDSPGNPAKWNDNVKIWHEESKPVNVSWNGLAGSDAVTLEERFALPFVQYGDLTAGVPSARFNMSDTRGQVFGYKDYWINDTENLASGSKYFAIVQLRDYNSIKNEALLNLDSYDTFKIGSSSAPDVSSLAIMMLSRVYNNWLQDATTFQQVEFAVDLRDGFTNRLTGANIIENFFNNNTDPETPPEPSTPDAGDTIPDDNGGGGTTGNGQIGGDGSWQDQGDDTTASKDNIHSDPIAGVPSGMFGGLSNNTYVVRMNSAQVAKLMSTVWSDSFIDYIYKTLGKDISQGILDIKYGNINVPTTGEAVLNAIAGFELTDKINCSTIDQFARFSFGTIAVPKYFGSFLDYEPYTQITLYLPKVACGIAIPASLVVGKSIEVLLTVDFVSGLGVYIVQNDDKTQIATIECNVLEEMPYAQRDFNGSEAVMNNVGRAASNMNSTVNMYNAQRISNAAYADAQQAAMKEFLEEDPLLVKYGGDVAHTEARTALASMQRARAANTAGSVAGGMVAAAVGAAKTAWNMTTNFSSTWNSGSASHMGGLNKAILKISRAYVQYPTDYTKFYGLPSSQIGMIGDCKGYFEVDKIYPEFAAPADEMMELERILAAGVYA